MVVCDSMIDPPMSEDDGVTNVTRCELQGEILCSSSMFLQAFNLILVEERNYVQTSPNNRVIFKTYANARTYYFRPINDINNEKKGSRNIFHPVNCYNRKGFSRQPIILCFQEV